MSDEKLWGQSDYWASRMESIGQNAGDCEDYVIAKFFTLIDLGIPQEKLYFTYVKENVIYKGIESIKNLNKCFSSFSFMQRTILSSEN